MLPVKLCTFMNINCYLLTNLEHALYFKTFCLGDVTFKQDFRLSLQVFFIVKYFINDFLEICTSSMFMVLCTL